MRAARVAAADMVARSGLGTNRIGRAPSLINGKPPATVMARSGARATRATFGKVSSLLSRSCKRFASAPARCRQVASAGVGSSAVISIRFTPGRIKPSGRNMRFMERSRAPLRARGCMAAFAPLIDTRTRASRLSASL